MTVLQEQCTRLRQAARVLALADTGTRNRALLAVRDALLAASDEILAANREDLEAGKAAGLTEALLDRLALSESRIAGMAEGVAQVALLPDPVGAVRNMRTLPNGLIVGQRTVPLGVVGIIFEARPNVTVDAAALCLKTGNAVLLRGGKEAFRSNTVLAQVLRRAVADCGLPEDCVALVADTSRDSAREMMGLTGYLDVLVPRGGAGLIRSVVENAHVPVIETGVGICHMYVHREADLDMAVRLTENAKCSRPSVCNAIEGLLVDRAVAETVLPRIRAALDACHVEMRGCPETCAILKGGAVPAGPDDYDTEFLDYILAVKVVEGLDEAIDFIAVHGSGHSEAIVTENYSAAQRFLNEVDAAAVYVNASTRFTDGFEFGLGAELGISTQKLHARGPMGLEALTTVKHIILGSGQIR